MKKNLLVVLCLITTILLCACGTKDKTENVLDSADNTASNITTNGQDNTDPLADLREKTSLTIEDLDRIDQYRFPVSYTYTTYNWNDPNATVETKEYIYPENVDHKLLLPIHENMASREMINSVMDHGTINTTVDIILEN